MADLYKMTFPNGKAYIGATSKTTEIRVKEHEVRSRTRGKKVPVHSCLKKYGDDKTVETLFSHPDMELVLVAEEIAICHHGTLWPDGLNISRGGERGPGTRRVPPWNKGLKGIQKAWNKGRRMSADERANLVKKRRGKPRGGVNKHSSETLWKMSEARKRYWERRRGGDG